MRQVRVVVALLGLVGLTYFGAPRAKLEAFPAIVKIPDATTVRLSLLDTLNSGTNDADDPVHLEVTEDVKVGDVVAIPKGSTASGHVVEAEPKKRMGRAGKLSFSVDFVKAADGTNVRLRASSLRKGQEKMGGVIAASALVSPLFLLMHGKDVNIPKGTQFNAYVDGDREVTLGGAAPAQTTVTPSAPVQVPAPAPAPAPAAEPSTVVVKSTPDGADITVDGKFVGSTPSTLHLSPGDHTIAVEKSGFKAWQRTMTASAGGIVSVDATLEKNP